MTSTKERAYPVSIPSTDELRQLLLACRTRSPSGLRDRALLGLLAGAGLRVGEALLLVPGDLDFEAGLLTVRRGKGGRARVVGVSLEAVGLVGQWLERRAQLGITGRKVPLFCGISKHRLGAPLRAGCVRAMLRRRALRAGITGKRVHPHALRHYHAATLSRQGTPVAAIQQQLGHSNLGTTSIYLAHVAPDEVRRAVAALPTVLV